MGRPFFMIFIVLTPTFVLHSLAIAQKAKPVGGSMVVCVVQLEHADSEYLVSILKPFLSPEGSIVPYVTTNVIIIKDRQPVVDMLTKLFKCKPCIPISQSPCCKVQEKQEKSHPDQ